LSTELALETFGFGLALVVLVVKQPVAAVGAACTQEKWGG